MALPLRRTAALLRHAYRHTSHAPEAPANPHERWVALDEPAPRRAARAPQTPKAAEAVVPLQLSDVSAAAALKQKWKTLPKNAPYVRVEYTLGPMLAWLKELREVHDTVPAGATYCAALAVVGEASASAAKDVMADYARHAGVQERRVLELFLNICRAHRTHRAALATLRLMVQRGVTLQRSDYMAALDSVHEDDAAVHAVLDFMEQQGHHFYNPDLVGTAIRGCGTFPAATALVEKHRRLVRRYALVALAQVAQKSGDPAALEYCEAVRTAPEEATLPKIRYYNLMLTGYKNLRRHEEGLAWWVRVRGAAPPTDAYTTAILITMHTALCERRNDAHFHAAVRRFADFDSETLSAPCFTALMELYAKVRPAAAPDAAALMEQYTKAAQGRAPPAPFHRAYEMAQGRHANTKLPRVAGRSSRPS
eukprot:TRINITY_DN11107_c0_g1_i1.p1 TRINITY_DN11107_c0_g1~~TRINITY_DN11107_c0_g1_i1.p1  ORF type:complete len:423 (+),score=160.74 TRINITY_DN11107_c0_g1_i1:66-1334(+)